MNKNLAVALITALASTASLAAAGAYEDTGRIVSADARMMPYQVPHQECRDVQTTTMQAPSTTGGQVLGGLTGALVGSRFGGGRGQVATTIGGAIIGTAVGGAMASGPATQGVQTQTQCSTVYTQEVRQEGFNVVYDYLGHRFQVVAMQFPGNAGDPIRLRIDSNPVGH